MGQNFRKNTTGFIKLRRDLQEWEWYGEPLMVAFWVHLLINANWEDKEWRGELIQRGQLVTSLANLSLETGLSVKQVRIALSRLEKGKQILSVGANKWTKITICDYDSYMSLDDLEGQAEGKQEDKPTASEGQTEGKQGATTEEDKEGKKNKKTYPEYVERLYALYPSSTIRPEGKEVRLKSSPKNKNKIHVLIKNGDYTEEYLEYAIKRYVSETNSQYLKLFQTFLEQVPDYSDQGGGLFSNAEPQQEEPKSMGMLTYSYLRSIYKYGYMTEEEWQAELPQVVKAQELAGYTVINDENQHDSTGGHTASVVGND